MTPADSIDSIKRVEILPQCKSRPSMPDADAAAMAKLQTLQEIVSCPGEKGSNFIDGGRVSASIRPPD